MELVLEFLSLSILRSFGSEYLITAILSGLFSGVAGAYIAYLLLKRNENDSRFRNYFCEAMEHVKLANSYWDREEIQTVANELERAANSFRRASIYADRKNSKWCEILADNLLNQSRFIRKT